MTHVTITYQVLAAAVLVSGSILIGGRLLLVGTRKRDLPVLLAGSTVFFSGGLGYGATVVVSVLRLRTGGVTPPEWMWLPVLAWVLHDLGVTANLVFVRRVFRPYERWAQGLALLAGLTLWGGLAGMTRAGIATFAPSGVGWWMHFAVVWTYGLWGGIEAVRYGMLMRRRLALGLATPAIVQRFTLWAVGLFGATLATACASPQMFVDPRIASQQPVFILLSVATSTFGLVSIGSFWLALAPPAWYRRRVEGASSPARG